MNRHVIWLVVLLASGAGCRKEEADGPRTEPDPERAPRRGTVRAADCPIRVVGVVHSAGGRTRAFVGALAEAFDAEITWLEGRGQTADPHPPLPSTAGADLILLGGPIWGLGPTPHLEAAVADLELSGKPVVLAFTYLHGFDEAGFVRLEAAITQRGGRVIERLMERFPAEAPVAHLAARAAAVIGTRGPAWASAAGAAAEAVTSDCGTDGRPLCNVPAGPAWVGCLDPARCPGSNQWARWENVPAFRIERSEVTLADYRRCSDAGACPPVPLEQLPPNLAAPDRPVLLASAAAAEAFCRWAGRRLPTHAEWTRAGRGDRAQAFPWGDARPSGRHALANLGEGAATSLPFFGAGPLGQTDGTAGLAAPCSFPAGTSAYGACDLVGNVAEWVQSPNGLLFVGGSWMEPLADAVGLDARSAPIDEAVPYVVGVRCASD